MKRICLLICAALLVMDIAAAQWVSGYYPVWRQFGNSCRPADGPLQNIDFSRFTHIMHFGTSIRGDDASLNIPVQLQGASPAGVTALTWKAHDAGAKAILVIGGQRSGQSFLTAISTGQSTLINNIVTMLINSQSKRNGVHDDGYDGVDLDCEPLPSTTEGKKAFTGFISALRSALNLAKSRGRFQKEKIITVAVEHSAAVGMFAGVLPAIDQLNLMTYDWVDSASHYTWYNTALDAYTDNIVADGFSDRCAIRLVQDALAASIPAAKLGIGIKVNGMVLQGDVLGTTWERDINKRWAGVPHEPGEYGGICSNPGDVSYYAIMEQYAGRDSARIIYDERTGYYSARISASYLRIPGQSGGASTFISFDDQRAIEAKINYVRERKLGGVIVWDIGGANRRDVSSPDLTDSLFRAIDAAKNPLPAGGYTTTAGWNMLSVDRFHTESAVAASFATPTSGPLEWLDGAYTSPGKRSVVRSGAGYWVQYASPAAIPPTTGGRLSRIRIPVQTGWNMIGTISTPIAASRVLGEAHPGGGVPQPASAYYTYTRGMGYSISTELTPGRAYWVQFTQPGFAILDQSVTTGTPPGTGSGTPFPAGPVVLLSPADFSTNVKTTLTLTWDSPMSNAWYHLQIFRSGDLTTPVYANNDVTQQSIQAAVPGSMTTYFWRVRAYNSNGEAGPWSEMWRFTTGYSSTWNGGDLPCTVGGTVADLPALDRFHIVTSDGEDGQLLYVRNGSRGIKGRLLLAEEMPPDPPGVFHARFGSGRMMESIPSAGPSEEAPMPAKELPILLKNARYPLIFRWEIKPENNLAYTLMITGGSDGPGEGRRKQSLPLSDTGSILIAERGGRLSLRVEAIRPAAIRQPCAEQRTRAVLPRPPDAEGPVPEEFGLRQNYPNPFNPSTEIRYQLPEDAHVRLTVYDLLGRTVKVLVDEAQPAGYKTVSMVMEGMASGVYYYRLDAGRFHQVARMVLAK